MIRDPSVGFTTPAFCIHARESVYIALLGYPGCIFYLETGARDIAVKVKFFMYAQARHEIGTYPQIVNANIES